MGKILLPVLLSASLSCGHSSLQPINIQAETNQSEKSVLFEEGTWPHYLSHLKVEEGEIVDYKGKPVPDQEKGAGILAFDVGKSDLQQCADALMRLRAEYLFGQKRFKEIGFHFVSCDFYTWEQYCNGVKPVPKGNGIRWIKGNTSPKDHASLRKYLDIVYTYASTISLAKELKPAKDFAVGTVIITPGSPGHCFIIIDEKVTVTGEKLFRLAEGYTPAQSIYVLRNPDAAGKDPWQPLSKGPIHTTSYSFVKYQLGKFE